MAYNLPLNKYKMTDKTELQKQYSHNHIMRMDILVDRLSEVVLKYKPKGRRNIGIPRTTWKN